MTDAVLAFRAELRRAALRRIAARRRRLRLALVAASIVAAAVAAGITVAATHWPLGEPAPPAVVNDFKSYTPQLGFNPDARGARLVARADDISLYATTTRQGTYCTAVGTPWRDGKTMGDGGSCVTRETVAEPIAAGVRDVGRRGEREAEGASQEVTLAIVGKVADPRVRTVRFDGFFGEQVERPIGEQGFFVAGVDARICPEESWTPTFVALDDDGNEVARATINLIHVQRDSRMSKAWHCGFSVGPHGPYDD
jgi:hypothetical protein